MNDVEIDKKIDKFLKEKEKNNDNICKNCKHWKEKIKHFGECKSGKIEYLACEHELKDYSNREKDKLYYTDNMEWTAELHTGEEFGCIYFEGKDNG